MQQIEKVSALLKNNKPATAEVSASLNVQKVQELVLKAFSGNDRFHKMKTKKSGGRLLIEKFLEIEEKWHIVGNVQRGTLQLSRFVNWP